MLQVNSQELGTNSYFDNSLQEFGYTQTVKLMHYLKENQYVDESNYKNAEIFDFGAGVGGSSIFFHNLQNRVTVVDLNKSSLDSLKSRVYFSEQSIFSGDGLELMKLTRDKVYDLVFALMFGPTNDIDFINTFLVEASRIIKDNGKVVVFSDAGTMSHFIESEKGKKSNFTIIHWWMRIRCIKIKCRECKGSDVTS